MTQTHRWALGDLALAEKFTAPLAVQGCDLDELQAQLRTMVLIRTAEEWIGDQVTAGAIVCPCHLAIGQEAVPVGVAANLRSTDRVFGTHRSHGHFLAQGGRLDSLLAEVLGKVSGASRGMGGSMHLVDLSVGFVGSVPIVGATVPLAVGAGLAAKMQGNGDVAVAYFGDGAMEEGAIHESMNFASAYEVPVIFVVENNLFSSHLHISLRQPMDSVARFADAHGIANRVVDGNDVVAVAQAAGELVDAARAGEGPGFLEAVTYRWRGHVGPREDQDVGVDRKDDLVAWKRRDPVGRLEAALIAEGLVPQGFAASLREHYWAQCEVAWNEALASPYPRIEELLDNVYAAEVAQ